MPRRGHPRSDSIRSRRCTIGRDDPEDSGATRSRARCPRTRPGRIESPTRTAAEAALARAKSRLGQAVTTLEGGAAGDNRTRHGRRTVVRGGGENDAHRRGIPRAIAAWRRSRRPGPKSDRAGSRSIAWGVEGRVAGFAWIVGRAGAPKLSRTPAVRLVSSIAWLRSTKRARDRERRSRDKNVLGSRTTTSTRRCAGAPL